MATWVEVQEAVRTRFQLDADESDEFALTLPRQAAGAREQRVMVRRFVACGREMIEVRSAFGELGEVDLETALRDVLQLPIGGLALHGRFLVVVHRASLREQSIDTLLFLVERVSQAADLLEEQRGHDRF